MADAGAASPLRHRIALDLDAGLRNKVMPYWYRTTLEGDSGYQLADTLPKYPRLQFAARLGLRRATAAARRERHLVGQSRMLFGFSHAHRHGYSSPAHDLLGAATMGYRFLLRTMLDGASGGFVWLADASGAVIDARKFLYGQAFAIYGLLEYHRASGLGEPVELSLDVYRRVQARWHDSAHGGWVEHGASDFTPLEAEDAASAPEIVGLRSANAYLHWMEALAELYDITRDREVRASLAEAIELTTTQFFPTDPERGCQYRSERWEAVARSRQGVVSYGHAIEFAWLLLRAERVLGRPPSWAHFDALVTHALQHGFDHERGGFFTSGDAGRAATDREKVWWVQAEGLAALTDRLSRGTDVEYVRCLDLLLDWILRYQMLPRDGIWLWSLEADGRIRTRIKASGWKAAYHDLRAMIKFIDHHGSLRSCSTA